MAMTGGGQTAYAGCRKKCSDVNPQLGKRRQRRWEQIRNSGIDARGSGIKSAIREPMPEALGPNPRSGNRRKTFSGCAVRSTFGTSA